MTGYTKSAVMAGFSFSLHSYAVEEIEGGRDNYQQALFPFCRSIKHGVFTQFEKKNEKQTCRTCIALEEKTDFQI